MKVLVLEADHILPYAIERIVKKEFKDDEVKTITNVYYAGKNEIVENAIWADAILFQSTFYHESSIAHIVEMILKIGKPYFVFIQHDSARQKMSELLTDKECFEIKSKGIKFYQVDRAGYLDKSSRFEHPFDFDERADKYAIEQAKLKAIEDARLKYVQTAAQRPTGRKIRIMNILTAPGKEWSALKEGDIVDEVDMSKVETKYGQGRGVWVMGLTEGIKLLNEVPYKEYEIVSELHEDDVIQETLNIIGKHNADQTQFFVIKGMFAQANQGELLVDDLATDILDFFDLPRRNFRHSLKKYLHSQIQLEAVN